MKANTYPIFEADQILTSGHLNDLVVYLEEQERLTRNKLIGIGIACGLELKYAGGRGRKATAISKGVGVTSEGFLVVMDETICTHIREKEYTDPVDYPDLKGMKLMEMLTAEEAALEESKDVSPLSTVSENFLQEKAVLLYLEKLDEDLKNCIPEDCNDKGKKRIFTIRKLLVEKADLRALISAKEGYRNAQTETTLAQDVNGAFYLPEIGMQKVVVPAAHGVSFSSLQGVFNSAIVNGIPQMVSALSKSERVAARLFQDVKGIKYNESTLRSGFEEAYKKTLSENAAHQQYFYDFLCDLADAYDEFREHAFDLLSICCPNESLFGCHLMLGDALPTGDCAPSVYRHGWYPSPILDTPNHLHEKVKCLFDRLFLILENFRIPSDFDIEITPSKSTMYPLSQRAQPFYYSDNSENELQQNWDYESKRRCKNRIGISKFSERFANRVPLKSLVATRRLTGRMAENDFFRIEGHIGENYRNALQEIQGQRDQFGLAFDIVAVKLGRQPDAKTRAELTQEYQCSFQDLDAQYARLRQEMLCFLTKESNYFADIEYNPKSGGSSTGSGAAAGAGDLKSPPKNTGKAVFDYTDYSKYSHKYYQPPSGGITGGGQGFAMKKAATGQGKSGTVGELVMSNFINTNSYVYNVSNILNEVLVSPWGAATFDYGTILLRIQYPLQMIALIEDAVQAIPDDLYELDYDDFKAVYVKLLDKAKEFKAKIEENLASDDFQAVGNEEDISDHLDRFVFDCNLMGFQVMYSEYRARVDKIEKQSLLSEYAKTHRGLEHTAGVPKGGTFVLVYHDENTASRPSTGRPKFDLDELTAGFSGTAFDRGNILAGTNLRANTPKTELKKSAIPERFELVEAAAESSFRPKDISRNPLENIGNFVLNPALNFNFDLSRLVNKTVVADFSLPYICCSDCPPVSYVFPQTKASLSLPKNVFCTPDSEGEKYPFIVSPEGGVVKGTGVSEEEGRFVFDPSDAAVQAGMQRFTYEVEGKTAELSVEVLATPEAKFELTEKNIQTLDGLAFLSIQNESQNADSFTWDVNGKLFTDRDLQLIPISNIGDKLTVKLTATNRACFDTEEKTLGVAAEPLVFDTENGGRTFCADSKTEVKFITKPAGGKLEDANGNFELIENSGEFSFVPNQNYPALYDLKYTDKKGRSATLQLLISQPNAQFSIVPKKAEGQTVFVEFLPVDQTGDTYIFRDGGKEILKTGKLGNVPLSAALVFPPNSPRKTVSLEIHKSQCTNSFSIQTTIKDLIGQLQNRGGNGGRTLVKPNDVNVGRGSNSAVISNIGSNSKAVTTFLIKDLGMNSVDARNALTKMPLTISGISNDKMKKMESTLGNTGVNFVKK